MPSQPAVPATDDRLREWTRRADAQLQACLPAVEEPPQRLHQAMRYAVTGGGKRIRPLLAYAAAEAIGLPLPAADAIGCALELIHAYSLVHDDLPAMDDDDIRRGRPTCHLAFDEATAILAGDALQALAFEILAEQPAGGRLVADLARACGSRGMAGGQAIDLAAVGCILSREELEHMHALKTGALIRAAVRMPALRAASPPAILAALDEYGACVGLAFQIKDDLLDVEGDTATIGKPQGSDAARNKPTFPAAMGLQGSRELATSLFEQALASLRRLDGDTTMLDRIARYIVERSS